MGLYSILVNIYRHIFIIMKTLMTLKMVSAGPLEEPENKMSGFSVLKDIKNRSSDSVRNTAFTEFFRYLSFCIMLEPS